MITDKQIEAAAAMLWEYRHPSWGVWANMSRSTSPEIVLAVSECRFTARAALEAGEAVRKEEARPAAETREWWPDEAFAYHYGPTPRTEEDR